LNTQSLKGQSSVDMWLTRSVWVHRSIDLGLCWMWRWLVW